MSISTQTRAGAQEVRILAEDPSCLPEVAAAHVDALNVLAGIRVAFRLSLATATIVIRPEDGTQSLVEPVELAFVIGASAGRFMIPAAALDELAPDLGVRGRIAALSPLQRNILIEEALASNLAELEDRIGEPVRLGPPDGAGECPIKLCWTIDCGSLPHHAELHLDAAAALKIGNALDEPGSALGALTANLVQPIHLCAGIQHLTIGEYESLRAGDIVMCQQFNSEEPFALIGNHLIASLRRGDSGLVLTSTWQDLRASWEHSAMSKQDTPPSDKLETLADLPVQLVFEIGRAEFPLKEIARMGEGTVIHTSPSLSSPVNIMANGRLVGKGELIRIGEGLGVRVVRLSTDG
ncbi:YscQ/HrcQ family type III secretion apparatus protein [Rhizobium sullae]|uniref:YscQ/HrcQ family type III secretion apparatus protein n=1 Tax=Rhizobium sullae TaxID=50338 RepID=A0A2N0DCQ3_RHISU|nr:type III secretion system cytoplasmic ring protein SctQ [Rhizobium sullae]PKA43862.1 YscQ/HrcQ family type III secretion apparatus protein [Rhizobium sullae]